MGRYGDSTFDAFAMRRNRVATGLTQQQLADIIGVSQGAVAGWENGTRTPSPSRLRSIARVCEVSLEQLLKPRQSQASPPQLAARREELGRGVEETADRLGISVDIFARVEDGELLPQLASIDQWAAAYSMAISEFRTAWLESAARRDHSQPGRRETGSTK